MKKLLLSVLFYPLLITGQTPVNHIFPDFYNGGLLPTPIQFKSHSLFAPIVNNDCLIQAIELTEQSNNPISYILQYNTPNSFSVSFGMGGVGVTFNDDGFITTYGVSFGLASQFFYDSNNIVTSFSTSEFEWFSDPIENTYIVEWGANNESCVVINEGETSSTYQFDEFGNLLESNGNDSIAYIYNESNMIKEAHVNFQDGNQKKYQYDWLNENLVELIITEFSLNSLMDTTINNVSLLQCELDSNQYITKVTHLNDSLIEESSRAFLCSDGTNIFGCIDDTACNFNPNANYYDYSCTYPGCTDETACNYNPIAGCDDASCEGLLGCIDESACNYSQTATCDNGLCEFSEMYFDCDGNCYNDFDLDQQCDEIDNCIEDGNPDQEDADNDGEGDACDYDDGIGIEEISGYTPTLIKMIGVLGQEHQEHKKGSLIFYIYDNGKVDKKFIP